MPMRAMANSIPCPQRPSKTYPVTLIITSEIYTCNWTLLILLVNVFVDVVCMRLLLWLMFLCPLLFGSMCVQLLIFKLCNAMNGISMRCQWVLLCTHSTRDLSPIWWKILHQAPGKGCLVYCQLYCNCHGANAPLWWQVPRQALGN